MTAQWLLMVANKPMRVAERALDRVWLEQLFHLRLLAANDDAPHLEFAHRSAGKMEMAR